MRRGTKIAAVLLVTLVSAYATASANAATFSEKMVSTSAGSQPELVIQASKGEQDNLQVTTQNFAVCNYTVPCSNYLPDIVIRVKRGLVTQTRAAAAGAYGPTTGEAGDWAQPVGRGCWQIETSWVLEHLIGEVECRGYYEPANGLLTPFPTVAAVKRVVVNLGGNGSTVNANNLQVSAPDAYGRLGLTGVTVHTPRW